MTAATEVKALIHELHEVFWDSDNMAQELRDIAHQLEHEEAGILKEAADHIRGMYSRVRVLEKLAANLT